MWWWNNSAVSWPAAFVALAGAAARCEAAEVIERAGNAVDVIKRNGAAEPAAVGNLLVTAEKLKTGDSSRAVLNMNPWQARVDERSLIEIIEGGLRDITPSVPRLERGRMLYNNRESKGETRMQAATTVMISRGTQVLIEVLPDGTALFHVLEGSIELSNSQPPLVVGADETGEAAPGAAPRKTARLLSDNLLQWALYYPAVLEPQELGLTADETQAVAASVEAYTAGNLLAALERYPADYRPVSDNAKVFHAAVLLATGGVDAARRELQDVPAGHRGRAALERLIAAIAGRELAEPAELSSAGGALAESYYRQSRRDLEGARAAAQRATRLAPDFGFAWTRLAEMEFSFGNTRAAARALERGVQRAPRNAQAHALRGFLLGAENRMSEAHEAFEHALELDRALGNAWLGRGLIRIKQGARAAGRQDLLTATTVEPTRSFLYSYHGKAEEAAEAGELARKDFARARKLDPHDPTPRLYAALQLQNENRPGEAIRELGAALRLSGNRALYRSKFLLEEDRAVGRANLAKIYQNAGMPDLAVREATRAVEADPTHAPAHFFLANSLDALRDPRRINLRYETAWYNELLLANLLAPVGGGSLSQFVSQQEYSKLLESDGVSGVSSTDVRDDGFFSEQASLAATHGRLGASVDFSYWHDNGSRPNNATTRREIFAHLKYQVSPEDIVYARGEWQNGDYGDVFQNFANAPANLGDHRKVKGEPNVVLLGWNHRWESGRHTLLLLSRVAARSRHVSPARTVTLLQRDVAALDHANLPPLTTNPDGSLRFSAEFNEAIAPYLGTSRVIDFDGERFDYALADDIEVHSGELQQSWRWRNHQLAGGARWQTGKIEATARLDVLAPELVRFFSSPAALERVRPELERRSVYAYDWFQVSSRLTLLGGVSWDWLETPENFRRPPLDARQSEKERLNGKAGFTWAPAEWATIRGLYSEALGGVTFDESVRLEPVQLAGFNQAFRTVLPESVAGSVEAPRYKDWGLSVEGAGKSGTWWAASLNVVEQEVHRTTGVFDVFSSRFFPSGDVAVPSFTTERLSYREQTLTAGVSQLLGKQHALGLRYRRTEARFRHRVPELPVAANQMRATLHELTLTANWNAPTGWFALAEANAYAQRSVTPRGGDFVHVNAEIGRRFNRLRHAFSVGVLNLTGRDYHLHPLNYLPELARARTCFVRSRVSF